MRFLEMMDKLNYSLIIILNFTHLLAKDIPVIVISPGKTPQSKGIVGSDVEVIDRNTISNSSELFIGDIIESIFKRYNNLEMKNNESTEIEINVQDLDEKPLQNILASDADENIKSYLAVMPGTLLSKIYARYGARVLEGNVRSFLQNKTKVN